MALSDEFGTVVFMKDPPPYPADLTQFRSWFATDEACLDYLDTLRFGDGFQCPYCPSDKGWKTSSGRWSCGGCGSKVSPTAATIFAGTRLPLTVWFAAAWEMLASKNGISALELQRNLGIHSYQTAWSICHKYRSAMNDPKRKKLSGLVEMDESMIGGVLPGGGPGRGSANKVLIGIAVEKEIYDPVRKRWRAGRARVERLPNANAKTLGSFANRNVELSATVETDGWLAYRKALVGYHQHHAFPVAGSGKQAHQVLPAVHRVAALFKRFWLGTLQGSMGDRLFDAYLSEFVFRFNRRKSKSRGLLWFRLMNLAVASPPKPYRELAGKGLPKSRSPRPPAQPSLTAPLVITPVDHYPWR